MGNLCVFGYACTATFFCGVNKAYYSCLNNTLSSGRGDSLEPGDRPFGHRISAPPLAFWIGSACWARSLDGADTLLWRPARDESPETGRKMGGIAFSAIAIMAIRKSNRVSACCQLWRSPPFSFLRRSGSLCPFAPHDLHPPLFARPSRQRVSDGPWAPVPCQPLLRPLSGSSSSRSKRLTVTELFLGEGDDAAFLSSDASCLSPCAKLA